MTNTSDTPGEAEAAAETIPTTEPEFPTEGRLLGLDFGTKRLGYSVSDGEQKIASPLENYTRQGPLADGTKLMQLVTDYRIVGVVVGLPVHMSGDESVKSLEAREFGQAVRDFTNLPVCFWDERYTTSIAEAFLISEDLSKKKRKARLDKLASQIMLQSFLDSEDRTKAPAPLRDGK